MAETIASGTLGSPGGVIQVRAEMIDRTKVLKRLDARALIAAIKEAGFRVLEHWHDRMAPNHFKKSAVFEYSQYGKYYSGLKGQYRRKSNRVPLVQVSNDKLPLVDSGHLRSRVLLPVMRGRDFTSTTKRTSLRIRYGRPAQGMRRAQIEIARLIEKYGLSRAKAEASVLRKIGYSPAMKARITELVSAISPREAKTLGKVFKATVVEVLNNKGASIKGVNA